MNNNPIFYDSRFRHNDSISYVKNVTIEDIYLCPKCNEFNWKKEILKDKNVNTVV